MRPPKKGSPKNSRPSGFSRPVLERIERRAGAAPSSASPRLSADLYGHHAVREALLNPQRRVQALYVTADQAEAYQGLVHDARRAGLTRPDPTSVTREALDRLFPEGSVHQGVALRCSPLPEGDLDEVLHSIDQAGGRGFLVMLDQVTDPHNFGAILRSACVFGAAGVIVQRRHSADLNATVAKIACGGMEHVPVIAETNLARTLETLKDHGFVTLGLDERGTIALPEWTGAPKTVLVLGAEGPGLRRLVREGCDTLVRLPTFGPISSLNVSNAAAVSFYHLATRIP